MSQFGDLPSAPPLISILTHCSAMHTATSFHSTTKEYLELRHNSQVRERILKEENEALRSQNEYIVAQMQALRQRTSLEAKAVKAAAEQQGELYAEKFRQQALAREENLCVLKEQYAAVQKMYDGRVKTLETRLSKLRKRYKVLETRRAQDFEGVSSRKRRPIYARVPLLRLRKATKNTPNLSTPLSSAFICYRYRYLYLCRCISSATISPPFANKFESSRAWPLLPLLTRLPPVKAKGGRPPDGACRRVSG